jgi:peptidyl-tRNA hydrolase, PTH1 family
VKAIVGLGNPGAKYRGTRHNVGFAVVDEIAGRAGVVFLSAPANAVVARWRDPDGGVTLLAKPLTYMNESGQAVGDLVRYYKVDLADLLVIVDEAQLPLGKLRARARGSAGGHNGLKSLIGHFGEDFSRLRVGIGRGPERTEGPEAREGKTRRRDLADHVLSRFEPDEEAEVDRMVARAADAAETFVTSGIAAVMNGYNGGDPATTE